MEWHQGELLPVVRAIVTNLTQPIEGVVHLFKGRGAAGQRPKEGEYGLNRTRLSYHQFVANQVRLQHFASAYNLESLLRNLQGKPLEMGGRNARARRIAFQLTDCCQPGAAPTLRLGLQP